MSEEQLPGEEPKKNALSEENLSPETNSQSTDSSSIEETNAPSEPIGAASQEHNFPPANNGFPPPNNGGGFPPNNMGFGGLQQSLPNATIVLVLGILSIVTCCCFYGIIGLVLGTIALVLSKKDRGLYLTNIGIYTESSFKNLNAGRVCAIIGLILSILILVLCIGFVAIFGWAALSDKEAMKEMLQNIQ